MFVYRSTNSYTGVLRPGRSFSIYDSNGREVLHTSSPAFRTYDELVKHVDDFPTFRDVLFSNKQGELDEDQN